MTRSSRHLALPARPSGSVTGRGVARGSEGGQVRDDDGTWGRGGGISPAAGLGEGGGSTPIAITKDAPFPRWCGPTENTPPQVTGTAECPDEKSLPGCGCNKRGETAPCWTYKREFRGLGD